LSRPGRAEGSEEPAVQMNLKTWGVGKEAEMTWRESKAREKESPWAEGGLGRGKKK